MPTTPWSWNGRAACRQGEDVRHRCRRRRARLHGPRGVEGRSAAEGGRTRGSPADPLLGLGNLSNLLAAIAVGLHFDILLDDMVARAATLVPAYHRGEVLRLPGGVTLIDDSHNSSPAALGREARDDGGRHREREEGGSARRDARTGRVLPSSCTARPGGGQPRRPRSPDWRRWQRGGGDDAEAVRAGIPSVGSST